ncbi:MAG: HEAT repeat domain-containing protein [Planctomycetes bacterium]|nr:HEAT repeat domain-containing protein [Planctomycetota bacterium]
MNATIGSICALLKNNELEVQRAAALVLARLSPREPSVSKALGEALSNTTDPELAKCLLQALRNNPHETSIRYLFDALDSETIPNEELLDVIAAVGPKAVSHLRKLFLKSTPEVRCIIAQVLPRIQTDAANAFLIDIFHNKNIEVVRAAIHALREVAPRFNKKERSRLFLRLKSALGEKRISSNHSALLAIIISLGIDVDPRAKKLLLPYTLEEYDEQTRRYALISLEELEYPGESHGDVIKAITPILDEENENIVSHAVGVLSKIHPRKSDADKLIELLENQHSCVQSYAIRSLGLLNTITYARMILHFLWHKDHNLRHTVHETLSQMSSAINMLLEQLAELKDIKQAEDLVSIIAAHSARITKPKASALVRQLFDLMSKNDTRYQLYRDVILLVDSKSLRTSVFSRVSSARKRKDYNTVANCLTLLVDTEFMAPELKFDLAVAKLKTSRKESTRAFRQSDYCLELIAEMLHLNGKGFVKDFLADSSLDLEDYYYVGFHFSERLNTERRFGADVLRHVVKKGKRKKIAAAAREKLKVEGH